MQELAELSAQARDIALSRFRLLEPHLEQHRSSRQTRKFAFRTAQLFWLLRQIASKDLGHIDRHKLHIINNLVSKVATDNAAYQ
jgi:hypothetical protein